MNLHRHSTKFALVYILFVTINVQVFAQSASLRILTSNMPLASIVAMLLKPDSPDSPDSKISIESMTNSSSSCPCEYHLKPSDLKRVYQADLIIYIDEKFDHFITKISQVYNKKTLKIADCKTISWISHDHFTNWHFWMDLDNVKHCLFFISEALIIQFPYLAEQIHQNLNESLVVIEDLKNIKRVKLASLKKVLLLDHYAEYFFTNFTNINYSINQNNTNYLKHNTLHSLSQINQIKQNQSDYCLVMSTHFSYNTDFYQNLFGQISILNVENWHKSDQSLKVLFKTQYLNFIDTISKCNY